MNFFEDYKEPKTSRIGITGLLSNITTRPGSHKGGWARLLRCQLINMGYADVRILDKTDKLEDSDVIIYDLGAEFSGALNMFGGLDVKVYTRLKEIQSFKGKSYSWRNQLPNLLEALGSRVNNTSTCEAYKQEADTLLSSVCERLSTVQVFHHAYRTRSLLIGDSHTPGVWSPNFMIERRDGRTLAGLLERDTVRKYITSLNEAGCSVNTVQIHCSSIDIRHHLCREQDPEQAAYELACKLLNNIKDLPLRVILTETMGIEDESRELPKTGYYKGTAFFGDWNRRNMVREYFNSKLNEMAYMNKRFISVVGYPVQFFDENEKLKFEVMEKPGSVHVSPEFYNWDLDTNKARWIE